MFSLAVLNISQCRHCIVSILSTRDAKSYIINGHWGRGYMPHCRHHILNILLSEVLSSAFNPSLLVWISLFLHQSLSPFSYHLPRVFTEFPLTVRIQSPAMLKFTSFNFPFVFVQLLDLFTLNFILSSLSIHLISSAHFLHHQHQFARVPSIVFHHLHLYVYWF